MSEIIQEILFQMVLFITNTIQTITGFAGTLLAMPFSIRLVGVEQAKAVLNIFTLVACLIITLQNLKYLKIKSLLKMVGGMFLGMLLGIYLFQILPMNLLLKLYAILIILVAVSKMFGKKNRKLPEWMMLFILLAAGIIHGMFLSGGALLVVYAVTELKDKNEFRATIAPVWVILNGMLIFSHYQLGYYTPKTIMSIGISMIPLALSILLGNLLYRKLNQKQFLMMTYILLLIAGGSLLI